MSRAEFLSSQTFCCEQEIITSPQVLFFVQIQIEASRRHWINLTNDDSRFLAQRGLD